jgi:hypothetical protein
MSKQNHNFALLLSGTRNEYDKIIQFLIKDIFVTPFAGIEPHYCSICNHHIPIECALCILKCAAAELFSHLQCCAPL